MGFVCPPGDFKGKEATVSMESDRESKCDDACAGSSHNAEIGKRGERAAVLLLERKGFEILETNWRCKAGEADIIAFDEDALVFVEVKTRVGADSGMPAEAVTPQKRSRYEKIAAWYLSQHDVADVRVRFDVIDVLVVAEDRALIRHIVNAFGVGGR